MFEDAFEVPVPTLQKEFTEPRKLEMEDFSEKDDSTDDDQEIFFSAEEENVVETSQEKRDKFKAATRRKKKRQSKKKNVNYPEEMIANPKIKKFWRRRYSLFSKFDEGIKMDVGKYQSLFLASIQIKSVAKVLLFFYCGQIFAMLSLSSLLYHVNQDFTELHTMS